MQPQCAVGISQAQVWAVAGDCGGWRRQLTVGDPAACAIGCLRQQPGPPDAALTAHTRDHVVCSMSQASARTSTGAAASPEQLRLPEARRRRPTYGAGVTVTGMDAAGEA